MKQQRFSTRSVTLKGSLTTPRQVGAVGVENCTLLIMGAEVDVHFE